MAPIHFWLSVTVCVMTLASAGMGAQAQTAKDDCQSEDVATSIAGCTALIDQCPAVKPQIKALAFRNRGIAYKKQQDWQHAIADLTAAIATDGKLESAYNDRGNVYTAQGTLDLALADYNQAIALAPNDAFAFNNRGVVYAKQGAFDEALADFSHAIKLNPTFRLAFSNRSNAFLKKDNIDGAIGDLTSLIALAPLQVDALKDRARAYARKGDQDHAIADYKAALRLTPHDAEVMTNLGLAFQHKGDVDGAIAQFNAALAANPSFVYALADRGFAFEKKGAPQRAEADYRAALKLSPRDQLAGRRLPLVLAALTAKGGKPPVPAGTAPIQQKRVALVIGNAAYPGNALSNPVHDAADVSAELKRLGFDVVTGTDLTLAGFSETVARFVDKAQGADVAVFYYSGHAMQVDGENWIVPIDTRVGNLFEVQQFNVSLQRLLATVDTQARTTLVFLDACRNNPFSEQLRTTLKSQNRAMGETRGLARVKVDSPDTLVVFATQPDDVAADGDGRNSPFTTAFLKEVDTPGVEVETLMKRVTADVKTATGDKQRPERLSGLTTEFYFAQAKQ